MTKTSSSVKKIEKDFIKMVQKYYPGSMGNVNLLTQDDISQKEGFLLVFLKRIPEGKEISVKISTFGQNMAMEEIEQSFLKILVHMASGQVTNTTATG